MLLETYRQYLRHGCSPLRTNKTEPDKSDPLKSQTLKQYNSIHWCLIGKHFWQNWQSTWRSFIHVQKKIDNDRNTDKYFVLIIVKNWIYSLNRFRLYMKEKFRFDIFLRWRKWWIILHPQLPHTQMSEMADTARKRNHDLCCSNKKILYFFY